MDLMDLGRGFGSYEEGVARIPKDKELMLANTRTDAHGRMQRNRTRDPPSHPHPQLHIQLPIAQDALIPADVSACPCPLSRAPFAHFSRDRPIVDLLQPRPAVRSRTNTMVYGPK